VQFIDKQWTMNLKEALVEYQAKIFEVVGPSVVTTDVVSS